MQGMGDDRSIKNHWLWQGMERLGIQVLNVAEDDIAGLQALGVKLKDSDRFISANLISTKTGEPLLKPYVVKQIALKGSNQKYRVGFLGLSSRESFLKTDAAGYTWADPQASAKKWLPELRKECDFLIVLACLPAREAVQLAVDNTNIDIIMSGFKHQMSGLPARINQSTILYAEDEGKTLGELRFSVARGQKVDVQPLNHALTRNVKDEPEMAALISQAKAAISQEQRALVNQSAPLPVSAGAASFATSARCAPCHAAAFDVWQKSQHAHAIEILRKEKKEFDSSCVGCHVTGNGRAGGFVNLNQTPQLANVQCEACHGSGIRHAERPGEAKMAKLTADACLTCHTKSNSPEFEFASYWSKIKH
jgi:cytochrome c554/c'-like protein